MNVIDTFGRIVQSAAANKPDRARKILLTGWKLQNVANRVAWDKTLSKSAQYLAVNMMDVMKAPLRNPDQSAIVSIFTPCELLHLYGLHPYNPEGFSCYLSASHTENSFLAKASEDNIPETLCSYHRVFIGAAERGVMPRPKCIVSTNLVCDANNLTFRKLAKLYDIPHFIIDVPFEAGEGSVEYVAGQLRELNSFLSQVTGKKPREDDLLEITARSKRTIENYARYQQIRGDRQLIQDLVTPLYEFVAINILLGTPESEQYSRMVLKEAWSAGPASGTRIFWIHTMPFWMPEMKELLRAKTDVQIVGTDMATSSLVDFDPAEPYEAMARRMVYNAINGPVSRRIESAYEYAKDANADGAVWFCHWGCKHTLGGANLAKKYFEERKMPLLILDGDGCDKSNTSNGGTATRMEAFIEMLKARRPEMG